jgi:hypothetical protein
LILLECMRRTSYPRRHYGASCPKKEGQINERKTDENGYEISKKTGNILHTCVIHRSSNGFSQRSLRQSPRRQPKRPRRTRDRAAAAGGIFEGATKGDEALKLEDAADEGPKQALAPLDGDKLGGAST